MKVQPWRLEPLGRVLLLLKISGGIEVLGPILGSPSDGQALYEEAFGSEGMCPMSFDNRPGFAQLELWLKFVKEREQLIATSKPQISFLLGTLDELGSARFFGESGASAPAVIMRGKYGFLRLVSHHSQPSETTGGARDDGDHNDAPMSDAVMEVATVSYTHLTLPTILLV